MALPAQKLETVAVGTKDVQHGIAERIKEILQRRGMSQSELALKAGMSKQQMSFLLSGQRSWNQRSWEAVSRALGISPAELFGETEVKGVDTVMLSTKISPEQFKRVKKAADDRMLSVEEYIRLALGEQLKRDVAQFS